MKLPDFEAWAIFAKVAENLSFTAAADELGSTKATVSKAVSRLEARIRTPLFYRTSRRLTLTESGAALLENAQSILNQGELAQDAALEEAGSLSGIVRIAAPMSLGISRVAPLLAEFLLDHPDLVIDLQLADAQVNLIEDRFDMALRVAALPDSSLVATRLTDVQRHIIAAPDYLERRSTPNHPAQLGDHDIIFYSLLASREVWHFRSDQGEEVSVTPTGPLRVNNGDAMLPALRHGLGIGLLPDFIVGDDLNSGALINILPEWHAPPISLYLVSPPSTIRPRRVNAVKAFLVERLSRPAQVKHSVTPPTKIDSSYRGQ